MKDSKTEFLPLAPLSEDNRRLREENVRLRKILASRGIPVPPLLQEFIPQCVESVPQESQEERASKRIALFRNLFRGRQDAYSKRWENSDGRSGYAPAALKDRKAINKSRPEDRKKVDQQTRTFLPLTNMVIENHLLGKETIGIYALLPDETCWFLAVDFDKKSWQDDARAFLDTCEEWDVPAALERSRSGNGGHIWIFFDHALAAMTARKLGCAILTRTMERRHQLGLDSYDRFFPSQDTMPKGGFGNLIALPFSLRRASWAIASSSTMTSTPIPINGSSCQRFSGCPSRPQRRSLPKRNAKVT